MKSCFTFDEIREIESKIINSENVPSILLMENAGKNSCKTLLRLFPKINNKEIFILCGKGNNAGDGFTLARHLLINDIFPTIVLLVPSSSLKGDALVNYDILKKLNGVFIVYNEFLNLAKRFKKHSNLILIDAILGTGIKGNLDEQFLAIINFINQLKENYHAITIVSLDIPSGLISGEQINPVINADITISMGTFKNELLFGAGKENCGKLEVVPIGITENILEKYNSFGKYIIEFEDIKKLFPKRKKISYKYSNGKVLVIGGSKGLSGAVVMSSLSCLKSGTGGVVAAIPESISTVFNKKLFEVMTVELNETESGSIAKGQYDTLKKRIDWADIVLLGPGISTNEETKEFVFEVIKNCVKPMVIDADGLNIISDDLSVIKNRTNKNEIFITPHLGEFSRLTKIDIKEIKLNRFELMKNFVDEYNLNLSLKSESTVSCFRDPELKGKFYINSSGNEALATSGSGDVLSGIIASMYAQTKDAFKTLICGNYLHGYCADLYASKYGNKQTATPQDIIKYIPKAITKILN